MPIPEHSTAHIWKAPNTSGSIAPRSIIRYVHNYIGLTDLERVLRPTQCHECWLSRAKSTPPLPQPRRPFCNHRGRSLIDCRCSTIAAKATGSALAILHLGMRRLLRIGHKLSTHCGMCMVRALTDLPTCTSKPSVAALITCQCCRRRRCVQTLL